MKRIRLIAAGLLAVLIALLFACVAFEQAYPWLVWVRAFAEAGAVGALADWYSTVALFRHPLGLRIPHTAIIPRNQQRIATRLGEFVESNFLRPELIVARLGEHNAAKAVADWLSDRANSEVVGGKLLESLPAWLDDLDETALGRLIDSLVMPQLRSVDASRVGGAVLQLCADLERHQPVLDRALRGLEKWLTSNVHLIEAKFSETSKFTPAMFDSYVVGRLVKGSVALLHEVMASPDHELRRRFGEAVRELIVELRTHPGYRRYGRVLWRDCLRRLARREHYDALLAYVRARVAADLQRERSLLRGLVADALVSVGTGIANAPKLQHRLNGWWLEMAHALMVRHGHRLAALIAEVVKGWSAKEVSSRIEMEIGRDLEFIRINGAVVGGVAGVVLHAVTVL